MSETTLLENIGSIFLGTTTVAVSKTLFAPLDRVKLLLQLQGGFADKATFPRYSGIFRTLFKIPAETGFSSYYRGNFCHILTYFPSSFANLALFYSYRSYINSINEKTGNERAFIMFTYVNLAVALPAIAAYPLQVLWTKRATNVSLEGNEMNIKNMFADMHQAVGFKGVFRGLVCHLAGKLSYRPFNMGLYSYYTRFLRSEDAGFMESFLWAQSITLFSGFMVYPFETVSRRMMIQIGQPNALDTKDMIKEIYQNEGGVRGFYRGFLCIPLAAFMNALLLQVYDRIID